MPNFADLRAEAEKNRKATPPYVITGENIDPPIEITPWVELERTIRLSKLIGPNGEYQMKDADEILEHFCGDAFPRVWELCRKEHASVMSVLIDGLIKHFREDIDGEAAELPGGTEAS